jgi:glucose/mannose transport system permease protein
VFSADRFVLRPARWLIYAALTASALFFLAPLVVVLLNSVRTAQEIGLGSLIGWPSALAWDNYVQAWSSYCIAQRCDGIRMYMGNSLAMVIPATIVSTALGALAGYSISLWRFRGDTIIFAVVIMGVFLPEQMKLIPWALVLRQLGLSNTVGALILIHTVQGLSFTTLFCRNYFVGIPQDLMKAARVDGAGYFRIFWRIVLPLSPPILVVTVIWQFTGIWNEFLFGVVFTGGTQQPITAALVALATSQMNAHPYDVASAAVLIGAVPPLLIYLFGGKYFVRGLTQGAIK